MSVVTAWYGSHFVSPLGNLRPMRAHTHTRIHTHTHTHTQEVAGAEEVEVAPWGTEDGESDSDTSSDDEELPWADGDSLAPYLATPGMWISPLLRFAGVVPGDVVCDVGCGDCRVPIMAVHQFGVR